MSEEAEQKTAEECVQNAAQFAATVSNGSYARGQQLGLPKSDDDTLYTPDQLTALRERKGTELDVEGRMPVKITDHYRKKAEQSEAIRYLVVAHPEETDDLSGQPDPSNQLKYSPVEGLLHKYEMALMYVLATCSAHCRYCYRLDVIGGKEIAREDGTTRKKELAIPEEIAQYIIEHNAAVAANGGVHPETGRPKLTEVLLSGGDPMVLNNKKLANHMAMLAEAGITEIRIGTKELAFFPERFDDSFFNMLDTFHQTYPDAHLTLAVHFTHPDEFLHIKNPKAPVSKPDERYQRNEHGSLQWDSVVNDAVERLASLPWVNMMNQTPIINRVNDNPDALRLMQRELPRHGIGGHYFFQNREIEGHQAFAVPVEKAWAIFNESQKGLSGKDTHAKFAMSTEHGKIEVVSVARPDTPEGRDKIRKTEQKLGLTPFDSPLSDGFVTFKILRSPGDAATRGETIIAASNPEALWLTGYKDRILYDGVGIMQPKKSTHVQQHLSRELGEMYRTKGDVDPDLALPQF